MHIVLSIHTSVHTSRISFELSKTFTKVLKFQKYFYPHVGVRAVGGVSDDTIRSTGMGNTSGAGVVCLTSLDANTQLIYIEIRVSSTNVEMWYGSRGLV